MGLDSIIRNVIGVANKVTLTLQGTVKLQRWNASDTYGAASYASVLNLKAIVDRKKQIKRTESGELISVSATVLILQPIKPLGSGNRAEPIDPRDILTLPDGSTGPIVNASGFIDRGTSQPFFHEVWLG